MRPWALTRPSLRASRYIPYMVTAKQAKDVYEKTLTATCAKRIITVDEKDSLEKDGRVLVHVLRRGKKTHAEGSGRVNGSHRRRRQGVPLQCQAHVSRRHPPEKGPDNATDGIIEDGEDGLKDVYPVTATQIGNSDEMAMTSRSAYAGGAEPELRDEWLQRGGE